MAEAFFRAKLDGGSPDPDDLQACFEDAWDREAAGAAIGADENVDLLKHQAATLTRKYLDEGAPEIEPAALELSVQGVIGGVPVRGVDAEAYGRQRRLCVSLGYVREALPRR